MTTVKTDSRNFVLSEEDTSTVYSIITRLAHHYNGWYGMTTDDLISELWIDAVTHAIPKDGTVKGNEGLITFYLKRHVYSLSSYASRRTESQLLYGVDTGTIEPTMSDTKSDGTKVVQNNELPWSNGSSTDEKLKLSIIEILSLFSESSAEYKYLNLLFLELGFIDSYEGMSYKDVYGEPDDDELESRRGHTKDMLISSVMGYASSSSSTYKAIKYRVKVRLEEFNISL